MQIAGEILRIIARTKPCSAPVTEASHLYMDLGYDSLAFVRLLMEMEQAFSIEFTLMEMGMCIRTDRLIDIVERKIKEPAYDQTLADKPGQS